MNRLSKTVIKIISGTLLLLLHCVTVTQAQSPTEWQENIRVPSPEESRAWFPDLDVDTDGDVHLVWNVTTLLGTGGEVEQVYYNRWNGQNWLNSNDILPPQPDINRNALAIDRRNTLHLISGWFFLYHQMASIDEAPAAQNWSAPHLLNRRRLTYQKDLGVFKDSIHVVYDDAGTNTKELVEQAAAVNETDATAALGSCSECADIYYVRSQNGGHNWEAPKLLLQTDDVGSSRAQIEVDSHGRLYVAWDDGWDRVKEIFAERKYGVFVHSPDGGTTWVNPTIVSPPNWTNSHISVGADGEGGVLLVWRTEALNSPFYYMWSTDYGKGWNPPRAVPGFLARPVRTAKFDQYDMATDSLGNIHVFLVGDVEGTTNETNSPNLYHFVWDGEAWSDPNPIYEGAWYPAYPHTVIEQGNKIHVAWFIQEDPFDAREPHQVWYTSGNIDVPATNPTPLPTYTATPTPNYTPTPTSTPRPPTPTVTPTLPPEILQLEVDEGTIQTIYTDIDDITLILQSLLPAIIIVFSVVIGIKLWRRRYY